MRRNANEVIGRDPLTVVAAAKHLTAQHSNFRWHRYAFSIHYTRSLVLDASMVLSII